jgi:hypothetical protein
MAKVRLSVVVKDSHLPKFRQVVKSLKHAGMTIENELKTSGIVTGSVDEVKLKQLREVTGVGDIEEEQGFQIAPPESDVQ